MSKYRVKCWIGDYTGNTYYRAEELKYGAFWFPIAGHTQHCSVEEAMKGIRDYLDQKNKEDQVWYFNE